MTAGALVGGILLFLWWVDVIDRGTVIALAVGLLVGLAAARYDIHVESEARKRLQDDYERAKRRGFGL